MKLATQSTGLGLAVVFAVLFVMFGCGGSSSKSMAGRYAEPPNVPLSQTFPVGMDAMLDRVLPRSIRSYHWGLMALDVDPSKKSFQAEALTASDRKVAITGEWVDEDHVQIAVKVGYFGDREQEAAFLEVMDAEVEHWHERYGEGR